MDQFENARDISEAAGEHVGRKINVVVEVNVGLNRCGVKPGKPALELVQKISPLRHLTVRGVMGYEGGIFIEHLEEKKKQTQECNQRLVETKELIERNGFPVEIVTAGGSNTFNLTGTCQGSRTFRSGPT